MDREPETMEEARVVFSEGHEQHKRAEFPDLCVRCAEEEGQTFCATCSVLLNSAEEDDDGCCDTLFCSSCVWTHQEEEHPPSEEEIDE